LLEIPGARVARERCVIRADGRVVCVSMELHRRMPDHVVDGVTAAAALAHFCALDRDSSSGAVKCWGRNDHGPPRGRATKDRAEARPVAGLPAARAIATGEAHACAVLVDGTVQCWGKNESGQLGDGTRARHLTPVAVLGLSDVRSISLGARFSCALRADGRVLSWGSNEHGALGDGSLRDRLTPVEVAGLSDIEEIAAGYMHACARHRSGEVSCWGFVPGEPALVSVPSEAPVVVEE